MNRKRNRLKPSTLKLVHLEDRAVPAAFYVDPSFVTANASVTFQQGAANEKTGLTVGKDAFATISLATSAANTTAGTDQVFLSSATHAIDAANAKIVFTESADLIGSSTGGSFVRVTSNTLDVIGADGAAIQFNTGTVGNVSALSVTGLGSTGVVVGSAIRFESATGTVSNVSISDVAASELGINLGFGVVAAGVGANVTVQTSKFSKIGRTAVSFSDGATGKVLGNTLTGLAAPGVPNYGVEGLEGATNILISGNVFSGFSGTSGDSISAGVQLFDDLTFDLDEDGKLNNEPATAVIVGNTFTANDAAAIIGSDSTQDKSNAVIQHNNIVGNLVGIVTNNTLEVNALLNWWGPGGPLAVNNITAAKNNPGGVATSEVSANVLYRDLVTVGSPFAVALPSKAEVRVANSPADYRTQTPTGTVAFVPAAATTKLDPVFSVTFPSAVVLQPSDLVITSAKTVTPIITTTDNLTFQITVPSPGDGPVTVTLAPRGTETINVASVPPSTVVLPLLISPTFVEVAPAVVTPGTTVVDTVAPLPIAVVPPALITASPLSVVIQFSEPVTIDASKLSVTSPTAKIGANPITSITPSADGRSATVFLANITGAGLVSISLGAGAASDLAGNLSTQTGVVSSVNVDLFARGFSVGGGQGISQPFFSLNEAFKTISGSIVPFDASYTGGVRVANADFDGDGVLDTAVGTGPGVTSEVRFISGVNNQLLGTITPFESSFTGGIYLSAGDFDGDGKAEIVVSPDITGGPRVRVLSNLGTFTIADFFGIDDPAFRGGAQTGVGDIDGDGTPDLIVAAGFGGGPRIAGFTGKSVLTGTQTPTRIFADFFAYESTFRNGAFVTVGDVDGDGFAELITGAGFNGGPRVRVFSGSDLSSGAPTFVTLNDFFTIDINNRGGVRVVARELNFDGKAELIVGQGQGGGSTVTVYDSSSLISPTADLTPLQQLDLFNNFPDGVFVG